MKLGIFGGSFDPLHNEHINLIENSLKCVDKLILLPSYNPPHKNKDLTDFETRIKMLQIFKGCKDNIIIETIENELKLKNSYTHVILPKLKEKYPKDELFLIVGGDSIVNFTKWKNPEKIAREVSFLAFKREPYNDFDAALINMRTKFNANVTVLDYCGKEISSSELKARIELKMNAYKYIDKDILDYIYQKGLYCTHTALIEKLKSILSQERFEHSARTVIYAMKHLSALKLSYEKVFIAAILHDCAKEIAPNEIFKNINPKIVHQYQGKIVAKELFGIEDEEILDAIEFHTTGKPKMSKLSKLIYAADKLEEERDFSNIDTIRNEIVKDFDKGFFLLLKQSVNFLEKKGTKLDDLTMQAYLHYNKITK